MATKQDIAKREQEILKLRDENKGYLKQLQDGILSEKIASSCISANDRQIIEKEKQITELTKKQAPRMPVVKKLVKTGEDTYFAKNALSVVAFVATSIASALVTSTFETWIGGRAWCFLVIAALTCVIREWESKDEGYVNEYEDAVEADEESEDAVEADEEFNLI